MLVESQIMDSYLILAIYGFIFLFILMLAYGIINFIIWINEIQFHKKVNDRVIKRKEY